MFMSDKENAKWLGLIGISIAGFLGCLDLTIVNTALPSIQSNLKISVTQLQWVMTSLLLALTAFMVISGKLADLYGRKLCLVLGIILFAVSSLGVALAPDIHFLIFFRFLQGISIAFLYTAPVALIPSLFPEHQRGRATGLLIGANGLGLAIGPVIGGLIVSSLGWRWIFFINPPIILISFLLCWKNLTESKSQVANKKIDWWGFILLLIAIPSLILALVQGEAWGWLSIQIITLFIIAIIGLIVFYIVESRITSPIIEFHLLANRIFFIGLTANFALALFYAIDFFLIPLYLHYIHGQTGYQIGLSLLPATFMVSALSSVTGKIVDKKGPKGVLCVGLIMFTISALLQLQFGVQSPIYLLLFSYLIFGVGWACILSPSIVAALSSLPKESIGVGMGTIGTLHNLGGAIGLALGTLIYNVLSKNTLLSLLNQRQIPGGDWINQAIANTDRAVQIIQENTNLGLQEVTEVFHHYFLKGYQGAIWLLVISSLLALLAVILGLKNKKIVREKSNVVMH
jgi:EmrB/QacA subfamily drug resistance transporter